MKKRMVRLYKKTEEYLKSCWVKLWAQQRSKFFNQEWLYYGGKGLQEQLLSAQKRFCDTAKLVALFTVLGVAIGVVSSAMGESLEEQLVRAEYAGPAKHIQVNAKAEYRGAELEGKMDLTVLPKELTAAQESERLSLCAESLERVILGENESLKQVSGDLNLILFHELSGVSLSWSTSDVSRINPEGRVYLIGIKKPENVVLQAVLSIGKAQRECTYSIVVLPPQPEGYVEGIRQNLILLQEDLNKNTQGESLRLPPEALDGIQVHWTVYKKRAPFFLVPLGFFLIGIAYCARYNRLLRESKRKKEAIQEEVPNLALQLILLLNAGLVVSAAFEEILDQNKQSAHPLYCILNALSLQSAQSNLSFIRTFYTFSQKAGNRNLLRFATMVADHETRGSELVHKLEREREQLWESRLQRAKAKAREADTKLCMPLILLLLSLVVLSVAPALMEM